VEHPTVLAYEVSVASLAVWASTAKEVRPEEQEVGSLGRSGALASKQPEELLVVPELRLSEGRVTVTE
jgi:hypothetical protein